MNLSWNSIVEHNSTGVLQSDEHQDKKSKDNDKLILNLIGRVIKHNVKFVHLDLTSTGLGNYIVKGLGY